MAGTYQGGDQVLNYAPLRQDALKRQANQQKQAALDAKSREQSAKQAADIVAKINPNGLRDADIPEFSKKYEQFRNAAISVANAGSIQERAKASAELQNQLTDLQTFVNSSKNQANTLKEFGTRLSSNPQRASGTQFTRFDQVMKTPTSQLQNVDLGSEFKLGARPEVWNNFVKQAGDDVHKEARELAKEMKSVGVINKNGRIIEQYKWVGNAPKDTFINKLANAYQTNSEIKDYINQQSSQSGITPEQFIQRTVEANNDKLTWSSDVVKTDVTPKKTSGGSKDTSQTAATYRQQLIQGILDKDKKSIDQLLAYLPQGSKVENRVSKKTNKSKGGYNLIRVNIPEFTTRDGKYIDGVKDLDISLSKGDAVNVLNKILNEYTGENISPSKFNIEGGKARGKQQGFNVEPKSSQSTNNQTQNNKTTSTPKTETFAQRVARLKQERK